MKTRTILITAIAIIATGATAFAQPQKKQNQGNKEHWAQMEEKVKSEKIAFLTTELSITSEESADFWAVYNAADQKRQDAMREVKKATFALNKANRDENADLGKLLENYVKAVEARNTADSEAIASFRKSFGDEKAAKLVIAEEKFIKFQLFKLNGNHNGHGPQQGMRPHDGQGNGQGMRPQDGQRPEHRDGNRGPRGGQGVRGGSQAEAAMEL